MTTTERRIAALTTGQLGAFSRAQATDAGLSNRQLRSRVMSERSERIISNARSAHECTIVLASLWDSSRNDGAPVSGSLEQSGPNAFRVAGAPNTLMSQLVQTLLDIDSPVWVAGPTAAALYSMPGFTLRRPFHILVPADRNVRRNGVVVHRSEHLEMIDLEEIDRLAITSPVRTVIDLARHAPFGHLGDAVEHLVADGLGSEDLLHRRVGALRSKGRYGIPLLLKVIERREITAGGASWLEREYLRLLADAALPRPDTQVVLARTKDHAVRVDCTYPGARVVVELLGYRFHRTKSQMNHDATRRNALVAAGWIVYEFTYDHVTTDPAFVVAQTRRALAAAA